MLPTKSVQKERGWTFGNDRLAVEITCAWSIQCGTRTPSVITFVIVLRAGYSDGSKIEGKDVLPCPTRGEGAQALSVGCRTAGAKCS